MPDNSVHLMFSKILPYQALAKVRSLFVLGELSAPLCKGSWRVSA